MTNEAAMYEKRYRREGYYWGVAPSEKCLRVVALMPPERPLKLLDIGCGEGKDAVFFARCGYDVAAFDLSPAGLEKTQRLAAQAGVCVRTFQADVNDYRPDEPFDILYSSGVLHYIRAGLRGEAMAAYKACVNPGGLTALLTLVEKPFLAPPPEKEGVDPWRSGELFTYFHDWRIEACEERIFDCNSEGVPHQHAVNTVYARKIV